MDIDDKRGFDCCCGLVRSLAAMTMIPQSERSQLWLQGPQFPPLDVGGSRRSPSVPPRLLLPRRLPRRAPHTRGRRRAGGGAGAAQHRGRCDPARPGRAPPRGLHKVAGASRRGSRRPVTASRLRRGAPWAAAFARGRPAVSLSEAGAAGTVWPRPRACFCRRPRKQALRPVARSGNALRGASGRPLPASLPPGTGAAGGRRS